MTSRLPISPQVFAIFSALIAEKIGIHYDAGDRELLGDKVSVRALDAGFDSLLDYYYFLRYDPAGAAELDALIDALVVGETYFFRELAQLEVAVAELVAPRALAGERPRIWSAACSTGEEPFTIAMLLAERGLLGKVDLVASDISARALSRARAGVYGPRSLRSNAPPPPFATRWLEVTPDRVAVSAELKEAIDWRRINLLEASEVASLGQFDVIVCRNVLIYFHDNTARWVITNLSGALAADGALLVGISESLLRLGTALACEERGGVFLYRKTAR
ncbi:MULTISPECIES: protein-glutamate O-methyltransferase CheR [Sorangium]|uniref:protein-glutamate O-methyltransferase n=1 Tax=Sorangium cellulosum TaxID=56 RepID=A0A4P2QMG7_SORCE|nr:MULTISPECIES: protein-glutamate O-methyltransferase CheR [Sorangium]AUX31220.1 chemotaxis protein CheR [Sorangium cellulosum]WCQ90604.1 Chemotaxis protein methyltransferase 1 [Sorangium sp. Soce836]